MGPAKGNLNQTHCVVSSFHSHFRFDTQWSTHFRHLSCNERIFSLYVCLFFVLFCFLLRFVLSCFLLSFKVTWRRWLHWQNPFWIGCRLCFFLYNPNSYNQKSNMFSRTSYNQKVTCLLLWYFDQYLFSFELIILVDMQETRM